MANDKRVNLSGQFVAMTEDADTENVLRRAADGESRAINELLDANRNRLARMVSVRMDPRLATRVDPSDVVQETMATAATRLPDYLERRPLPLYPWLRQIAWEKLVDLSRRHIGAQRRSVKRQEVLKLSNESSLQLADRLVATNTSPSAQAMRDEMRDRVRQAMGQLRERDREVLVLIYLEQLSIKEISAILELAEKSVTMRHLRALERLRPLLK